ncbi:MAG: endonuclease [Hyphococcus sp.]|nr:MAG: endonuclease [Marinicaulis sp.]
MANERAKHLRKNQTNAERLFWRAVKVKRLNGFKFRRQHPLGSYVVDFICLEKKLIIELDGSQHAMEGQSIHDAARTQWLETIGFTVIRYWNDDIYNNLNGVLDEVLEYLSAPSGHLPPP